MKIVKIVITGGPCGGKSTIVPLIKEEVEKLGFYVIQIPETATQLILNGIAPWTCRSNQEYHLYQMILQMEKERIYEMAACSMPYDKILMMYDRGLMDSTVYMNDAESEWVFNQLNMDKPSVFNRYDAIFHLETCAKSHPEFYSLENNPARIETVEQACAVDDKTIQAWNQHDSHYIIPGYADFREKADAFIKVLSTYLKENSYIC